MFDVRDTLRVFGDQMVAASTQNNLVIHCHNSTTHNYDVMGTKRHSAIRLLCTISNVHDVKHIVVKVVLQDAAHNVKRNVGTRVTQVRRIVDRGAANVPAHCTSNEQTNLRVEQWQSNTPIV